MADEKKKVIYFCVDTESYTKQMLNNRDAVGITIICRPDTV
jgi:hypothetical protein